MSSPAKASSCGTGNVARLTRSGDLLGRALLRGPTVSLGPRVDSPICAFWSLHLAKRSVERAPAAEPPRHPPTARNGARGCRIRARTPGRPPAPPARATAGSRPLAALCRPEQPPAPQRP